MSPRMTRRPHYLSRILRFPYVQASKMLEVSGHVANTDVTGKGPRQRALQGRQDRRRAPGRGGRDHQQEEVGQDRQHARQEELSLVQVQ